MVHRVAQNFGLNYDGSVQSNVSEMPAPNLFHVLESIRAEVLLIHSMRQRPMMMMGEQNRGANPLNDSRFTLRNYLDERLRGFSIEMEENVVRLRCPLYKTCPFLG